MLALEAAEGAAEVVRIGGMLAKVAQLQALVEGLGSLLVARAGLALQRLEALLQLAQAGVLIQLDRVLEAVGPGLGPEALDVVADERGAGQPGGLVLEDLLGLGLGKLLEQALDGLGALFVPEPIDDAARGEVEEGLAVLLEVVVGIRAAVEGLDVLGVEVDGGGGVLNDLFPVTEGIVAGGAVGVVDGVGLAQDRLGIEPNGLLEVLGAVGLVAGLLQFLSELLALVVRVLQYGGLVDLRELVGGVDRGGLGVGGGGGGLGLVGGGFPSFGVPLGLLPFPPLLLAGPGRCLLGAGRGCVLAREGSPWSRALVPSAGGR